MTTITPAMAAHVLHHFGGGGVRAGSFTVRLIELITHADPTNRARLALGFPGYVAAVDIAQNTLGGTEHLRFIAREFGAVPIEATITLADDLTSRSIDDARSGS